MNTADPWPSVIAIVLVLFGAGHYYYNLKFTDGGLLHRARSVLVEEGSRTACDASGAASASGASACWTVGDYRMAKDSNGNFRVYDLADPRHEPLGGVRDGSEGVPEVFVDRPRLEKAVLDLESAASA